MDLWTLEVLIDNNYNIIDEKLRKRDCHYVEDGDGCNFWYVLNRRHTYSVIYDNIQKKKRFGGGWIYSIATKHGNNEEIMKNVRRHVNFHINCDRFKNQYEQFIPYFQLRNTVIEDIMCKKILRLNEVHKGCEFLHSVSFDELIRYERFVYKDEHCTQITFIKPTQELKTLDGIIVGYSYSGDILRIGIYKQ